MHPMVLLAAAILFEVTGTVMLRVSEGMTRLWPSVAMVAFYVVALYLLALVIKELQVGFTYAVWAGTGTAIIAVVGVVAWNEPLSALKVASLCAVVGGVVGLNLAGAH